MLYIPCPFCGPRDETEFTYGGPSHVIRPELSCTDRDWTQYMYHRTNIKGPYRERWLHSFGCGRWFNMLRDTATHEIHKVYQMDEPALPDKYFEPSNAEAPVAASGESQ
jgi:heterotetrameric sarcosine oxidase delta subunit